MSNRHHLPAGQNTHGGNPGVSGVDLSGGGPGGPRRRQPPPQYMPQYPQHMNPPMYANYMPYGPQQYYSMPPQAYQNGGMPSPGYMQYQNYPRSPPSMHQYVPMVGVNVPPNYPRPSPQSPGLSTPYQPPEMPSPMPPQTPSSTHSSQMLPPPTQLTPQTRNVVPVEVPPPVRPSSPAPPPAQFRPPLPWLSRPDVDFPPRSARSRRRTKLLDADSAAVSLPVEQHKAVTVFNDHVQTSAVGASATNHARSETPSTQDHPSEDASSTSPSTPVSIQRSRADTAVSVTPTKSGTAPRGVPPAVPLVPALPRQAAKPAGVDAVHDDGKQAVDEGRNLSTQESVPDIDGTTVEPEAAAHKLVDSAPPKPPTSWANLFTKTAARGAGPNGVAASGAANGTGSDGGDVNTSGAGFSRANASSLAEAIRGYRVGSGEKVSFIEPRGLINTGNMCYMNSVLQVLMFCVPFYDFLGQVSKRAAHSFKSDTPLIDAMIMFMHEFNVIKTASGAEQLQKTLKNEDLEKYGEPFTPEFVYEAIRQLSRFASMRRGHQQDAEEFLGFLLQSLDDECTIVMGAPPPSIIGAAGSDGESEKGGSDPTGDWLEVGRKQRAAVTRSSGSNSLTPINKIFGGFLRSEFRVPGLKDSITTEPYQPLQLDIGSPDIKNVVDALKGLTRPERLQGDFNSPRGKDVMATKTVSIETLPPVLILHLKRFQFDAEGHGTVKIWKNVGYPLELEIPREALSRQRRQTMGDGAMPKYRLISVVYHHGKNASGGHYTVDVRRQDGKEWIRLDDTVLRRVRSEDVAANGAEEDVKEKDNRKDNIPIGSSGNRFGAMNDEDTGDEDGWKEVTASAGNHKRWSSVVNGNGNGNGTKSKPPKDNAKDNKVAYLLFYQRV